MKTAMKNKAKSIRPTLSLCMIVRNEEKYLPFALESIKDIVNEMIVVDTGSTDRTVEIARKNGAHVFHFEWCDDFSRARNYSLDQATGDWILSLDADERIPSSELAKIRRAINYPEIAAVSMIQRIPQANENLVLFVDSEYCRLFRNHLEIRYQGRIHEQILPAIQKLNGKVLQSDIVIDHWAYGATAEKKKERAQRNLRLLLKDGDENPGDAFICYNLGMTFRELANNTKAIFWLQKAIENDDKQIKRKIIANSHLALSQLFLQVNQFAQAESHAKLAFLTNPKNLISLYVQASISVCKKDYKQAVERLENLIRLSAKENIVKRKIPAWQLWRDLAGCRAAAGDWQGAEIALSMLSDKSERVIWSPVQGGVSGSRLTMERKAL
jgi:glycosyltransferase involved in cell wall biosynthesis